MLGTLTWPRDPQNWLSDPASAWCLLPLEPGFGTGQPLGTGESWLVDEPVQITHSARGAGLPPQREDASGSVGGSMITSGQVI